MLAPAPAAAVRGAGAPLRLAAGASAAGKVPIRSHRTTAGTALGVAALPLAASARARRRKQRHAARAAEAVKESPKEETPWLEVLGAVLGALLDVVKGPPLEVTDQAAPGLKEMGKPALEALGACKVQDIRSGEEIDAAKLLSPGRKGVFFLTHWGDFNSWEVAQQLKSALQAGRVDKGSVSLVGIGSQGAAQKFAEMLELPEDLKIYTDERASCHSTLCFSRGALPQYAEQLNPYLRVFLMLLGVGSPGTIRTVLGGYIGDSKQPRTATRWIDESLRQGAQQGRFPTKVPDMLGDWKMLDLAEVGSGVWDEGFGKEGLRPFELATIRLQNMCGGIIAHWGELAPEDDELLVQQGGCVVAQDGDVSYYYRDKGILTYVPMDDAITALQTSS